MDSNVSQLWAKVDATVYAKDKQSSLDAYTAWATSYDKDFDTLGFVIPINLARELFKLIKNTAETSILDVAAGTGKCSEEFQRLGYKGVVDALDINGALLEIAKSKGLYRKYIQSAVYEHESLPVENHSYDAVICSGAMVTGHIDAGGVMSMARALKPGGIIIFNVRLLDQATEYRLSVDRHMKNLVWDRILVKMEEKEMQMYEVPCRESGQAMKCLVYIYSKL